MSQIRWGILGTGKIAHQFAQTLQSAGLCLKAIASRSRESAKSFQARYPISNAYDRYEDLIADQTIDAVYIALPNHLHAAWTLKAAQHAKHVLCEKPITTDYEQAVALFDALAPLGVCVTEGFMYRHHPQTALLIQLLQEKSLGQLQTLQADFSYSMGLQYDNIRLSYEHAGGSIMDVGCYPLSMARLIAGADLGLAHAEPIHLKGLGYLDKQAGVDLWATAILEFESGLMANLTSGTQVYGGKPLILTGSTGVLQIEKPWKPDTSGEITIYRPKDNQLERYAYQAHNDLFALEILDFEKAVQKGLTQATAPGMTWSDSLGNMRALDQWRAEIGLRFQAELSTTLTPNN